MLKKFFIIIITSVLISFLVYIFLLRFQVPIKQYFHNLKAMKNNSQYTILCLGDSSTAGRYPICLQKILNNKYPNKFSVIDCGITGIPLESILYLLRNNIQKYNPNIVICMMGLDSFSNYKNDNTFEDLPSLNNDEYYKKYLFFKNEKDFDKAEEILKQELKNNPNNEKVFSELAYFYSFINNKPEIGYSMAIDAINNKNFVKKNVYYYIIFKFNFNKDDYKTLKFYANKAINEHINIFTEEFKYESFALIKKDISSKQKKQLLSVMKNSNTDITYLRLNAIDALESKNSKLADEYFLKITEILLNYPNIESYNLYKQIIKILIDNNIEVICMQYPVRSIEPLKKQLKNEPFFDKITFISNEENFKQAIINKGYDKIFYDQFAGDFGHCTDLGNTMIAENIVKTLEKSAN